jgi:hypothetical protein
MGVGLDGRFAVIGAPFRDQGEIDGERLIRGGAYLFDVYTGEQIAQFLPVDPIRPGDRASISMEGMGYGVGISGGLVIIGAPYAHDENYGMYGAAYLYDIRKPREPVYIKRFSPSDGQWSDWFGMSAKIEDGRIIIGAPSSPTIRNWGGKALVYQGF